MNHEHFMQRCIKLAKNGLGNTSPNPLVGSVIVNDGAVIGEGWHLGSGKPHAEVNAISVVGDTGKLKNSTLYVNLEPCSHYGKTPPCTNLILETGIPRVVIGSQDPDPRVSGKGVEILKESGVDVIVDVLSQECHYLNRRFFTFHSKKRPYIILKWAQSTDGYIDSLRKTTERKAMRISGKCASIFVHRMRAIEDAILVGTNTALLDDPSLTTRLVGGPNPIRLLIDKNLKVPEDSAIFSQGSETIVYNYLKDERKGNIRNTLVKKDDDIIKEILNDCYHRSIQSLIVEGGTKTLKHFLRQNIWDETRVIISDKIIGSGAKAPVIPTTDYTLSSLGEDLLYTFHNL